MISYKNQNRLMLISNLFFFFENSCMQFISYSGVAFQAGEFCSENYVSKGSGARAGKSTSARELLVVRSLSLFFLHSGNRASASTTPRRGSNEASFSSALVASRRVRRRRCDVRSSTPRVSTTGAGLQHQRRDAPARPVKTPSA